MDASVAHGSDVQHLRASGLTDQSSADRARECLVEISQVDAASGRPDVLGSKSIDGGTSAGALKDIDQNDEFRQKLIALSYAEAAPMELQNEQENAVQAGAGVKAEECVVAK